MRAAALTLVAFLLGFSQVAGRRCPFPCRCAPLPLRCPPGVSSVFDDCGCCQVCARQLNEDCDKLSPCDPHKGLECNFGADPLATRGICWAKQEGRTCEYNGRIYQNGENFQPSCKHQCTCIDGAVGCQPLCPLELPLASLGCSSPRLLKVPGQCCKKFVCSKGSKKYKGVAFEYNSNGEASNNEIIYAGKGGHWKNLPAWRPFFQDQDTKQERKCLVQTTHWSPCSKSCGFGISTRINSNNPQCKLIKETRLCQVRPCEQPDFSKLKKGKKCLRTHKVQEPVRFSHAGCKSPRRYQPSFCGACLDGRCCVPLRTRTLNVPFHCPDGSSFTKKVMMIHTCQCGASHCPLLSEAATGPQYQLNGDIHKFLE
ncbi:protein CYR61-like [Notechis scutatus]|uniref:CCN family member 1 n=1 Tax=Notechis scutatus TaxID=8663 RepID=A0A6J1UQQ3_9SAUR|nr:protein CYR61-like [Notechis scutatus]